MGVDHDLSSVADTSPFGVSLSALMKDLIGSGYRPIEIAFRFLIGEKLRCLDLQFFSIACIEQGKAKVGFRNPAVRKPALAASLSTLSPITTTRNLRVLLTDSSPKIVLGPARQFVTLMSTTTTISR